MISCSRRHARAKRLPRRKGCGARKPWGERLTEIPHEEARVIGRREAIRLEGWGRLGTCLEVLTRQDLSLVCWLRACVERTKKKDGSGEQAHVFSVCLPLTGRE